MSVDIVENDAVVGEGLEKKDHTEQVGFEERNMTPPVMTGNNSQEPANIEPVASASTVRSPLATQSNIFSPETIRLAAYIRFPYSFSEFVFRIRTSECMESIENTLFDAHVRFFFERNKFRTYVSCASRRVRRNLLEKT